MFDIGWTELLVIGVIALIVVGPKDLPKMFRTLGQMTAKARNMAREFQRAMDDAADDTGVRDVARDLRKATSSKEMGLDDLNNTGSAAKRRTPGGAKASGKPASHAPAGKPGRENDGAAMNDDAGAHIPDDADAEAAADAELDAVTREMDRLREERDAARDRGAAMAADARPSDAPADGEDTAPTPPRPAPGATKTHET